jgi:hypothetical protein
MIGPSSHGQIRLGSLIERRNMSQDLWDRKVKKWAANRPSGQENRI